MNTMLSICNIHTILHRYWKGSMDLRLPKLQDHICTFLEEVRIGNSRKRLFPVAQFGERKIQKNSLSQPTILPTQTEKLKT